MVNRETLTDFIRLYRHWGLHFLPSLPRKKSPAVKWEQFQLQPPTNEVYRDWWIKYWHKGAGILLLCGQVSGNLFGLDFDSDAGWASWQRNLEETAPDFDFYSCPVVKTGRGWHLWARLTHPPPSGRFQFGEIHGDGTLLMAPPSLHPSGAAYHFANPGGELPVVDSLLSLGVSLMADKPVGQNHQHLDPSWVVDALRGVPEKQRNETATRLAGYFHRKGVPHNIILQLLEDFASKCHPPLSLAEVAKVVVSVSRYPQTTTAPLWENPAYRGEAPNGL